MREQREITDDTAVRVCRSFKTGNNQYGDPEWYLTTPVKNLKVILGLRHRDATENVKRTLSCSPLALLYVNSVCYALGVETAGANGEIPALDVPK